MPKSWPYDPSWKCDDPGKAFNAYLQAKRYRIKLELEEQLKADGQKLDFRAKSDRIKQLARGEFRRLPIHEQRTWLPDTQDVARAPGADDDAMPSAADVLSVVAIETVAAVDPDTGTIFRVGCAVRLESMLAADANGKLGKVVQPADGDKGAEVASTGRVPVDIEGIGVKNVRLKNLVLVETPEPEPVDPALPGESPIEERPPEPLRDKPARGVKKATKSWGELARKCGARRRKAARVRQALSRAAGEANTPSDVVDLVLKALSKEQRAALTSRVLRDCGASLLTDKQAAMWGAIGPAFAQCLLSWRKSSRVYGVELCGHVCRSLKLDKKACGTAMGVAVNRAQWRRSRLFSWRSVSVPWRNGRLGRRTVPTEKLEAAFELNSSDSCQLVVDAGAVRERFKRLAADGDVPNMKHARAELESDFVPRKSLADSIAGIHTSCLPEMSKTAVYSRRKHDCPQYRKGGSKRVDDCDTCYEYDHKFLARCRDIMSKARDSLALILPSYWDRWDALELVPEVTLDFVDKMIVYIRGHRSWDGRQIYQNPVAKGQRMAFTRAEDAAVLALAKKHDDLDGNGVRPSLAWYLHHFTSRDACKAAHDLVWHQPRRRTLYARMDFAENFNLPLGPREAGSWWYAASRLALSILVIVLWGDGLKPRYITYISRVLEKTPRYVAAVWRHMLSTSQILRDALSSSDAFELWIDSGNHFRAFPIVWFVCNELAEHYSLKASLCMDCEHHGKGACDGHIGKIKRWRNNIARRRILGTAKDLKDALVESNVRAKLLNGEAPSCAFVVFTPPARDTVKLKTYSALAKDDILITRTYCVSGEVQRTAATPLTPGKVIHVIHNHVYPGHAPVKTVTEPVAIDYCEKTDPDCDEDDEPLPPKLKAHTVDGWRCSYRKKEPERADTKLACLNALSKRHAAQSVFAGPPSSRHRTFTQRAAAALLSAQKKRGRSAAAKRSLARLRRKKSGAAAGPK